MDKLAIKIAGEIALSAEPGSTMKKWRDIFGVTQAELGKYLKISASTISDYEGNRRKSPGIGVVRRFVDALLKMDSESGGTVAQRLRAEEPSKTFFELHDFSAAIPAFDFSKLIEAKTIANGNLLHDRKLYGATVIDSIKVILEMPYADFPKLYGSSNDRAFIFTQVSTGRSPLVVIRTSPVKPSVIVLHKLESVDRLAVKIAQVEKIPLLTTKLELPELIERIEKL